MAATVTLVTPQGSLLGAVLPRVLRFSGIPFAQAPIHALRWRPPVPAQPYVHFDATRPGAISLQLPSRLRRVMGDFQAQQSEDCLNLTVWTPGTESQKKRPVLVWLHGGAWQSGAGALDWYSAEQLAACGDVVVVAPNYRLAAFGWLALPGIPANLGLLDQEAALDWTLQNIEAFGGDPERITVMGQSAGAVSIACMLTRAPRFERAIMQSPSLGRGFRTAEQAQVLAQVFLEAAGASDIDAARGLDAQALVVAQESPQVQAYLAAEGEGRSLFAPVLDGEILARDISHAFKQAAGRADVIVGSTRDEMVAFSGFGLDGRSHAAGEQVFGAPVRAWAADATRQQRQAWVYRFDYGPNPAYGACHCIELPFVFGTAAQFSGAPMLQGASPADIDRIGTDMRTAWLAFVRGESPGWQPGPQVHIFQ